MTNHYRDMSKNEFDSRAVEVQETFRKHVSRILQEVVLLVSSNGFWQSFQDKCEEVKLVCGKALAVDDMRKICFGPGGPLMCLGNLQCILP